MSLPDRPGAAAGAGTGPGRTANVAAAGALLIVGVVAGILVASAPPLLAPVVTSAGQTRVPIAQVDVGVAALVPLALGVVLHVVTALRPGVPASQGAIRWFERSLSASITVFLLAQLTGIRELGALVAIYALTSALVLFAALQDRRIESGHRPAVFGAMVGIVPWGLIAWYQIVPAAVEGPDAGPATWVRVLTLVILALFLAAGWSMWRTARETRVTLVLAVVTRSALALGVAGAIATGIA